MSKKVFLFFCIVSLIINVLLGPLTFEYRFYIIGITNFLISYYLLTKNPFNYYGWIFIFFITLLFNGFFLSNLFDENHSFVGMQLVLIYNISSLASILMYTLGKKKIILGFYILIYVLLCFNFHNINNYFFSRITRNDIVGKNLPIIEVKDFNNNAKILNSRDKVLVIDLWSNSCGYCIQAMPKFEKVYDYYKKDKDVDVFSINVDEKEPNRSRGNKLVEKFKFNNYFANRNILKKLNFNKVPNYMIIGKDGKIKYFGTLNVDERESYNNIYQLIENER